MYTAKLALKEIEQPGAAKSFTLGLKEFKKLCSNGDFKITLTTGMHPAYFVGTGLISGKDVVVYSTPVTDLNSRTAKALLRQAGEL